MTRVLLLFLLLTHCKTGFSQNPKVTSILKEKEVKTDYYEMAEAGSWVLFLPMEFGKSTFSFSQEKAINKLKDAHIARIDLVYSDFPAGQDFTTLTKKRFESLEKIVPNVFKSEAIEFRKVRQTIAKTKKTAESLQHGFFIYYRAKPTREKSKEEITKLKEMARGTEAVPETLPGLGTGDSESTSLINWCGTSIVMVDTTGGWTIWDDTLTRKMSWDSNWVFKKWELKEYIKSGSVPEIQLKDYQDWDSVYHITYNGECPDYSADYFLYQLADTTVSSVFKRNKWARAMVIADVTGSMYPYTSQLLKWLAVSLTDKQKRYFVFFNDGDEKEDIAKIIGSTGGIYTAYTNSYDEVEKTIEKAMRNGSGGDSPENNIEALLASDKLCATCDSIVMIVDNWAPVKDISLLSKYNKPVKVVVCGVFGSIHKDYLKLVRDTKGSLHLMEEDINNLAELKEGESIIIHGRTYKLIKGEFVDLSSKSI
jgi:hypothetical protein